MRKILFIAVFSTLAGVFNLPCSAAEAPKLLGHYDDWSAFVYKEGKNNVCYMASTPKKDEGKYTRRGDIYVVVTHRPAEKSFDVVNFVAGYTFKSNADLVVKIGNQKFTRFFTDSDKAWTINDADDKALVKAMARGERMIVDGVSNRGTQTKDTYSLKGFSRAYKAISGKCGKK